VNLLSVVMLYRVKCHLVTADLVMPGMSGVSLVEELLAIDLELSGVIFMSAVGWQKAISYFSKAVDQLIGENYPVQRPAG
jgi:DNA-binding response OmpR family regulator